MIPAFEKEGYLPLGIHLTTIDEFEKRFAYNVKRKELFNNLTRFINDVKMIGCKSIYIDGSFTTSKIIPGDIDLCWDNKEIDIEVAIVMMPALSDRKIQKTLYNADIFPAYIMERVAGIYFIDFFQKDKNTGNPKGIINIII